MCIYVYIYIRYVKHHNIIVIQDQKENKGSVIYKYIHFVVIIAAGLSVPRTEQDKEATAEFFKDKYR